MARWRDRVLARARQVVGALTNSGELGFTSITPWVSAFNDWLAGANGYGERVGAATRCLQLNSQQIATMPLRHRGPADDPAWLNNPDPGYTNGLSEAMFAAVWSIYARGDAFLWCTSRYADGFPLTWTVLDPVTMNVTTNPDTGARDFRSNGYLLDPGDVLQIPRSPRAQQLQGTGALEGYWNAVVSLAAANTYAADIFGGAGFPRAVLKSSRRINEKQAKDAQAQWIEAMGNRFGAPAVLPPEFALEQIAFSPKDLLLLESREFDSKQVASAFGVPAFLLNLPQADGLNYSNPAQLFSLWWRAELMTTARRIQDALSTWLARGNWVEFDPSVILRPDFEAWVGTWMQLLEHNVVTADECRAAVLDLPPLAQGEALDALDLPHSAGATQQVAIPTPEAGIRSLEVVQ